MSAAHPDDAYGELLQTVRTAHDRQQPLNITGGGSKRRLLGRRGGGDDLAISGYHGIISYRPEEMVLTARAGTPVSELVRATAERGQRLPFEPLTGAGATLGGTLACNLSGPARPWRGAVRDAVLGIRMINGRGELLRFGGEVMKNVAGYDVSRLQCGALGTLGLIVEASVRVLPESAGERTLRWTCTADEALEKMRCWRAKALPMSGACWFDGQLFLRLEGLESVLDEARGSLTGERDPGASEPWEQIRELSAPPLREQPLWCLSVAPATTLGNTVPLLIDWAGARRFYPLSALQDPYDQARAAGGHAVRLNGGLDEVDVLEEPSASLRALKLRLKAALDPKGIFNPGRLHDWL